MTREQLIYSSTDAAVYVGTSPRLLRRFLRSSRAYKNATQAGRYNFTHAEVKTLKKDFYLWQSGRKVRKPTYTVATNGELDYLDQDRGISVEDMHRMRRDPHFRRHVIERRRERMRRLEQRIIETGIRNAPAVKMEERTKTNA